MHALQVKVSVEKCKKQVEMSEQRIVQLKTMREKLTKIHAEPRQRKEAEEPAAKILYAGLERHDEGTERVMKAIENQGLIELSKLEKGLVVLATLTIVAPLLGFLGTVIGMIDAFSTLAGAEGAVDPTQLASGIYTALTTTAAGLAIALVAYFIATWLEGRIEGERQSIENLISAAIHGRVDGR